MNTLNDVWLFITAWYNLPFTLALLAFLGLSFLQLIGFDQDPEADVDLDYDADVDVDMEADIETDVDDLLGWAELLQFLGVGRIPVTMVLLLFLGGLGISGWVLNGLVLNIFSSYPNRAIIPISVASIFIGVWVTSRTARFVGRVVPTFSTTATPVKRLVSRKGWISSPQIDESYGQVKVRDAGGTLITVFAIVDPGHPSLAYGTEVFLVEYDSARKLFIVEPVEGQI